MRSDRPVLGRREAGGVPSQSPPPSPNTRAHAQVQKHNEAIATVGPEALGREETGLAFHWRASEEEAKTAEQVGDRERGEGEEREGGE